MKLEEIYTRYPDQQSCINYLELIRWGGKVKCMYCGALNITTVYKERRYHCNYCNTSFSVTTKTIFHKTKVELQKWFYLVYLLRDGEKKVSNRQLAILLNVTKDTASLMISKVNKGLEENDAILKTMKLE